MSGDIRPYVMFYTTGEINFGDQYRVTPNGDELLVDGHKPNMTLVQNFLEAAQALADHLGGSIPRAFISPELAASLYASKTVSYETLYVPKGHSAGSLTIKDIAISGVHYDSFEIDGGWYRNLYGVSDAPWLFLDANDKPIEL